MSPAVERLTELGDDDLAALCEAADAAILDGGGFGWIKSPGRVTLEATSRACSSRRAGSCSRPGWTACWWAQRSSSAVAQQRGAGLRRSAYRELRGPYAPGHGLARLMTLRVEGGRPRVGVPCAEPRRARDAGGGDRPVRKPRLHPLGGASCLCPSRRGGLCAASIISSRCSRTVESREQAAHLIPGNRFEGRRLRAAATRRDGECHGLLGRPGRPGGGVLRRPAAAAARGGPERRVRRAAGERHRGAVHPGVRQHPGAAGRRHPRPRRDRALAGGGGASSDHGQRAARNPELVREACRAHPGRIAVGIDARDGFVAIEGWARPPACGRWTWHCATRTQALRRSSTPTSAATACWRGWRWRRRSTWPHR